jgi:tetratricopeptide (TPR) repeat protein
MAWRKIASGEPELAVEYARRAHELSRRNPDYLNTLGVAQAEAGELGLAEATLRNALKLKPAYVDALVNLGKVLEKRERTADALQAFERAYALDETFPKLDLTLARTLRQLGRAEHALALLQKVRGETEEFAIALADCDFELHGEQAAIERLRTALQAHPEWMLARAALAHLLLSSAQWREGWRLYRAPNASPAIDKSMLLRGEQGIGDVLFFLRFAPALRAQGVHLTLAAEKKLLSVVQPGEVLDAVIEDTGQPGGLPIGELPLLLGAENTPPPWPFRVAQKADLSRFGRAPYLGVTWRAGTDLARRREIGNDPTSLAKALPPALLGAALRGWPGTVLVLQRGARPEDAAQFIAAFDGPVQDLSERGEDLPKLLATLDALDEYVAVSNTNVHLLAGLRKSARVLVPYPGEWRWMRRDGPSPWFPGFAVYRQPRSRDWTAPLAQLRTDLMSKGE